MDNTTIWSKIKREGQSFLDQIAKTSELFYLLLFTLYIVLYLFLKISW